MIYSSYIAAYNKHKKLTYFSLQNILSNIVAHDGNL